MKNKFNPKVSIIIPVYNGSDFLSFAIESALAQDYNNIEIIVVNDGSNDNGKTKKIAKKYGNKIRYFEKENGGVSTALNYGIKKMNGEYFSWLSHDDEYYSNKISKQIEYLSTLKNRNTILFSDYEFICANGSLLNTCVLNHNILNKNKYYSILSGSLNGITMLIKKELITEEKLFDVNLKCLQDYDMWFKLLKKADFMHMPYVLAKTRLHDNQETMNNPLVKKEGNKFWLNCMSNIPYKEIISIYGNYYIYYNEMKKLFKTSPYNEAYDFCESESNKIKNDKIKTLNKYKVSVIIPFFNRCDIIQKAINSVEVQTFKNTEIILINDGSTDNIDDIKKRISSYTNIVLLEYKTNKGPAYARNYGIRYASGDYISFLDSDDEFKPEKIFEQLSEMVLYDSIISHTSYIKKSLDDEILIDSGTFNGNVVPQIISGCPIATPTVMIKRQYLIDNNLFFPEDIKIGEDTCYWLSILKDTNLLGINKAYTIVNIDDNSAAYNEKKQKEGLKNILTYVLNDSCYRKYDKELANLCYSFAYFSNSIPEPNISIKTLLKRKILNRKNDLILFVNSMKKRGISATAKKVLDRVKRR